MARKRKQRLPVPMRRRPDHVGPDQVAEPQPEKAVWDPSPETDSSETQPVDSGEGAKRAEEPADDDVDGPADAAGPGDPTGTDPDAVAGDRVRSRPTGRTRGLPSRLQPRPDDPPADGLGSDDAPVPEPFIREAPPDQDAWRTQLEAKLGLLPDRFGVYLFRDARGRVLYVGKAKSLRSRVRSYFRGPDPHDERMRTLRRRIRALDYVVVGTETEALILEAHLIKQHSPRFNIRLKDDKRYPYIKITTGNHYPGMYLTRNVIPDGSRYYGPFTRVKDLRRTMKTLRSVFRLRNCTDRRILRDERECLQFFIGNCTAPCTRRVDAQQYRQQVEPLLGFLSGKGAAVVAELRDRMRAAAGTHRYEEAARLRDGVQILEDLMNDQRMTPPVASEAEVVGLAIRGNQSCAVFLHVDQGKVVGKRHRILTGVTGATPAEQLRALLFLLFLDAPRVPGHIYTLEEPEARAEIEHALSERSGHAVRIETRSRGDIKKLLDAAKENAHLLLEEEELLAAQKRARVSREVYELQEALELPAPPYRIEGFDISNIQGAQPVASIVCFQDGKPLKSGYRRLRMEHIPGPDDFAMMGEAVRRRIERIRTRGEPAPDLILIDGGIGQVGRARDVLQELGYPHLPLVGLAKKEEEIVLPRGGQPIRLPRRSGALQLLQRVRDEAHRFAVTYHRTLRGRAQKQSRLDSVPGIGPARRRLLLRRFGSVDGIRHADPGELAAVEGIGPKLARTLLEALRDDPEPRPRDGAALEGESEPSP